MSDECLRAFSTNPESATSVIVSHGQLSQTLNLPAPAAQGDWSARLSALRVEFPPGDGAAPVAR